MRQVYASRPNRMTDRQAVMAIDEMVSRRVGADTRHLDDSPIIRLCANRLISRIEPDGSLARGPQSSRVL